MKTSRFQWEYRVSASKLHKVVGEVLRTSSLFSNYRVFQEYPVNKINKDADPRWHFDWVILDLQLVIECHGKQHYEVVDFSGKSDDGGITAFKEGKKRDKAKRQVAIEGGWTYIEIPYTAERQVTDVYILQLYKENYNDSKRRDSEVESTDNRQIHGDGRQDFKTRLKERRQDYLASDKHQDKLRRARELRQQSYRRNKERVANDKCDKDDVQNP